MRAWPKTRLVRGLMLGMMLAPVASCGIPADLLNPGFLVGLGLDPATVIPQQGSVIVAFKNSTTHTATFYAFESVSAIKLGQSSRNFSVDVGPSEVKNEVLDCPVGLISPGELAADFTPDTRAAVVHVVTTAQQTQTQNEVDVAYTGDPLTSGSAYTCGDVIEIELSAAAGGTNGQTANQQQFVLTVQVIPGR